MQEERLWKGVGKNYTLYTEILGFNGFKIGTSWGRSGHVKFSVTMDKKYWGQETETGKTAWNISKKRGDREEEV